VVPGLPTSGRKNEQIPKRERAMGRQYDHEPKKAENAGERKKKKIAQ